jgi:hypothetical protein
MADLPGHNFQNVITQKNKNHFLEWPTFNGVRGTPRRSNSLQSWPNPWEAALARATTTKILQERSS